jgi:glycine cleavage system H protein
MGAGKCPFLETTTVFFCKAYPMKKMIPVGKGAARTSPCSTPGYCDCAVFKERNAPEKDVEHIRGFLLQTDYFFHPRHVWLSIVRENESEVRLGVDDFTQQLVGAIERVSVPPEGTAVKENGVCFLLHSGQRVVKMVSPADGVIHTINPRLAAHPALVNHDPYHEGWILSMHLAGEGIKGLYYGNSARRWLDWEGERLKRMLASDLGLTAADGGEPVPGFGERLSEAQWGRIVNQFLG